MLNITRSQTSEENPNLREEPRIAGEDNVAWLARALPSAAGGARVALFGGRNRTAFRLRVAQAHARRNFTPSHWSHAVLLEPRSADLAAAEVVEISLERGHPSYPPATNAVQESTYFTYANERWYPNVCVLELPVAWTDVRKAVEKFKTQRDVSDTVELAIVWLAYVWGVGKAGNPLLDGNGIPSSAMLEYVVGATGLDLTPGLASRSSCPEAIWQAARFWHEYYEKQRSGTSMTGAYTVEHWYV